MVDVVIVDVKIVIHVVLEYGFRKFAGSHSETAYQNRQARIDGFEAERMSGFVERQLDIDQVF